MFLLFLFFEEFYVYISVMLYSYLNMCTITTLLTGAQSLLPKIMQKAYLGASQYVLMSIAQGIFREQTSLNQPGHKKVMHMFI